jgi:hypothetical protein
MASYAVECGSKTDVKNGKVTGEILNLSSEDDNFTGLASKDVNGWSMSFSGKEYPPNQATARVIKAKDSSHVDAIEVTVVFGTSSSGVVGEKLVISKPYSDEPTFEVYNMGGFTGPLKTANYKCISFID